MNKYITLLLILVLATVSCKEEIVQKPDNLLSKEQMVGILYDITLVNSIKGVNRKKMEDGYMHLDTYLYKKHDTDSTQFAESNNYYASKSMMYSEIYAMVEAKLKKERAVVGKELEAEQKRKDSVQKAKKLARTNANKKKDSLKKPTQKVKAKPEFKGVESDG